MHEHDDQPLRSQHRCERSAKVIGASEITFRKWVSIKDRECRDEFLPKWIGMVESMCWSTVKGMFNSSWADQWSAIADDEVIDLDILNPYKELIRPQAVMFLSKHAPNTNAAVRASMAANSSGLIRTMFLFLQDDSSINVYVDHSYACVHVCVCVCPMHIVYVHVKV